MAKANSFAFIAGAAALSASAGVTAQDVKPADSKGGWDYSKLVATIPAAEAFQPLADSTCPLVKK